MGQKVNPHGLRVGVINGWDSRWFAKDELVGDLLVEDNKIRNYLKTNLYQAGIPRIEIERDSAQVRIFIHCSRPGVIIGKGGMGEGTMRGCRDNKALHCVFPAGCAVVAATCVEKILSANWKDLGMPETLWTCKVKEFGPLIVSIDTHGHNIFEENKVIDAHEIRFARLQMPGLPQVELHKARLV